MTFETLQTFDQSDIQTKRQKDKGKKDKKDKKTKRYCNVRAVLRCFISSEGALCIYMCWCTRTDQASNFVRF